MNKPTILIIEENAIARKTLRASLENAYYAVVEASDGASAALQIAKQQKFDLIIQALFLQDIDGFLLNRQLREITGLQSIPIFVLLGFLSQLDKFKSRFDNNTTIILKPIDPSYFLDVVKSHLPPAIFRKQLDDQSSITTKLEQRYALLKSQLSLIDDIANSLTTCNKDIDLCLKEALYLCLDATGITKGALYLKKMNNIVFSHQFGYTEQENVESFFGELSLMLEIIKEDKPLVIPSKQFPDKQEKQFLKKAHVKSAFTIPLFSNTECLGILFLGSDRINLSDQSTVEFVRTLGRQFAQSIALASAFETLKASATRHKQLVELSPDAILIQQDGTLVYANRSGIKLLCASNADELYGRSFYHFIPLENKNILHTYIEKNKKKDIRPYLETKIINLQDNILDVEMVVSPFTYQESSAIYIIMRDITKRKQSTLHLEIQYEIAWIFAESTTLFVATGKMLNTVCMRLGWDCGLIWAVDKEQATLRCIRMYQTPFIQNNVFQNENQNLNLVLGSCLPGQVWKERKAIWTSDVLHETAFSRKASAAEIGLNTNVAFPIVYENKVLGVIELFSKNILQPNHEALLWLESFGNQLGLYLMRKHLGKQMLYMSGHDVLTGLSNRRVFEECLDAELASAKKCGQGFAVLILNIDHFTDINISKGHPTGDLLLKEIAKRLSECLRAKDKISKLGGDQFIILIHDVQHKNEVSERIEIIQNQLLNKITLNGKSIYMAASIGVSLYPEDGSTVQTLMKAADIAMNTAKACGKNNFQYFTSQMEKKSDNRNVLKNDLGQALKNNEFILHYQPKIDLAMKKIVGIEALIRWHKHNITVFPKNFISVAEESDLIIPIGEWVIKNACLQNKIWQDLGLPPITMAVNLSVRNLNNQLLHVIEKILTETNINPNTLEVELTESVLMENVENNILILHSLKEMGLKISIDDFGTGYSSLSYLKRFPIDTIKIDQSFVRNITTDPDDAAIVTAIIALAHNLNFKTIAEGVETKEQLKFLCEHHCDEVQGFYYSRPLPAAEITGFLQNVKIEW